MQQQYTTLLFDLDDTLLDLAHGEYIGLKHIHQNFYRTTIVDFDKFKELYKSINSLLWNNLGQIGSSLTPREISTKRFEQLNYNLKVDFDIAMIAHEYEKSLGNNCDWLPGVKNTIEFLYKEGYALGIVTNGLVSVQYLKYERHLLNKWFNCFIVSDEVGVSKPDKEIFSLAFSQMALNLKGNPNLLDPVTTLYIGDSLLSDGRGAKNYGMDFCFINTNNITLKDNDIPVKYNLSSVSKLPYYLGYKKYGK